MNAFLDRALKLTWLGIGALLLVFLLAGLVMMASQVIGNAGAASEAERVAGSAASAREEGVAVRYWMPDSIHGTTTRIVRVHQGEARGSRSSYESRGGSENEVNVMFVDADGVRLLLDRPAYIRDLSYPGAGEDQAPREWISYVLALDDTDRSGKVDARDAMGLYVTDLDGRDLRPVLRPPLRYHSHAAFGPSRILVYALDPASGVRDQARMRQRAFLYDVRASRLTPYAAMDSAAEQAARVLRR